MRLDGERDTLGLYLTGHPFDRVRARAAADHQRPHRATSAVDRPPSAGEGGCRSSGGKPVTVAGLVVEIAQARQPRIVRARRPQRPHRGHASSTRRPPAVPRDLIEATRSCSSKAQLRFDEFIDDWRADAPSEVRELDAGCASRKRGAWCCAGRRGSGDAGTVVERARSRRCEPCRGGRCAVGDRSYRPRRRQRRFVDAGRGVDRAAYARARSSGSRRMLGRGRCVELCVRAGASTAESSYAALHGILRVRRRVSGILARLWPLNFLDFEQPIAELEAKIEELQARSLRTPRSTSPKRSRGCRPRARSSRSSIFANLTPWQIAQLARHPQRPYTLDYVAAIFDGLPGAARRPHVRRRPRHRRRPGAPRRHGRCMVIGHQKGRDTKERVRRNFGMPKPEGYRKALRLMKLAERFGLPVFTFIDTPGAYPGIGAEERGQSEAIARNLFEMARLEVPIICTVIGEGGSGGALAIGVGDRLLMLQYSIYSVISPEGCASILWKSADKKELAAEAMGITADRLLEARPGRQDRARAARRRAPRPAGRWPKTSRRRCSGISTTVASCRTDGAARAARHARLRTLRRLPVEAERPWAQLREARGATGGPATAHSSPRWLRRGSTSCSAAAGAARALCVAFSGGLDSTVLLHAACEAAPTELAAAPARRARRSRTAIRDRRVGEHCARRLPRRSASTAGGSRRRVARPAARAPKPRRATRAMRRSRELGAGRSAADRAPSRRPARDAAAAAAARRGVRRPRRHAARSRRSAGAGIARPLLEFSRDRARSAGQSPRGSTGSRTRRIATWRSIATTCAMRCCPALRERWPRRDAHVGAARRIWPQRRRSSTAVARRVDLASVARGTRPCRSPRSRALPEPPATRSAARVARARHGSAAAVASDARGVAPATCARARADAHARACAGQEARVYRYRGRLYADRSRPPAVADRRTEMTADGC